MSENKEKQNETRFSVYLAKQKRQIASNCVSDKNISEHIKVTQAQAKPAHKLSHSITVEITEKSRTPALKC